MTLLTNFLLYKVKINLLMICKNSTSEYCTDRITTSVQFISSFLPAKDSPRHPVDLMHSFSISTVFFLDAEPGDAYS